MHEAYEKHNGQHGVRISYLLNETYPRMHPDSVQLMSYDAYQKRGVRYEDFRLKEGKGKGSEALVRWKALRDDEQDILLQKFGNPIVVANPLEQHYTPDADARRFYTSFKFDDDTSLKPHQIERYTVNASVLMALKKEAEHRLIDRESRGGSAKRMWKGLIDDVEHFNNYLKANYNTFHTLPHSNKLKKRYTEFLKSSYASLIHGNNKNNNAAQVTPLMIQLWMSIYAGQTGLKPNHTEVYRRYLGFMAGRLDIINQTTGELYDPTHPDFREVSETTVFNYQNLWENEVGAHLKRSGNAQVFRGKYVPYHKLFQPRFAGSMISIDDRQPPFEYAHGRRIWFYNGIDLASEFFVAWVYGESKEGIIAEFYRQLVRNFEEWGLKMPYELEAEKSLNSSYTNTFLQPGAMFQAVRIEANNARGKRIERYYETLRYEIEKGRPGWLARPFALDEANQKGSEPVPMVPKDQLILECLQDIEDWNNSLHSNQQLYPGMTRYQVFIQNQHPDLVSTNWAAILPHLGYKTETSMKAGRITLRGKHRVVGFDGEVATGDTLINVMKQIEGEKVTVYWLDDNEGEILKALVYGSDGRMVCELLGDLAYNRSSLERTAGDIRNRELTSAYTNTVLSYIKRTAKAIEPVLLIEKKEEQDNKFKFTIPGLRKYNPSEEPAKILPPLPEDEYELVPTQQNTYRKPLRDRF